MHMLYLNKVFFFFFKEEKSIIVLEHITKSNRVLIQMNFKVSTDTTGRIWTWMNGIKELLFINKYKNNIIIFLKDSLSFRGLQYLGVKGHVWNLL